MAISKTSLAEHKYLWSKVPQVTLAFWCVKILATTVGETGGDALSMTLNLGYAVSSLILLGFFVVVMTAQVTSRRYHPVFYWTVVVATTTVGTTTSDYLDRTVGLGYVRSSAMLLCGVIAVLVIWHFTTGKIAFRMSPAERMRPSTGWQFWFPIRWERRWAISPRLRSEFGFERGALIFAGLIVLVAAAHYLTRLPDSLLFWCAYILTRPLGATLGDTLTKPRTEGGLALGRIASSLSMIVAMVVVILLTSQRKRPEAISGSES